MIRILRERGPFLRQQAVGRGPRFFSTTSLLFALRGVRLTLGRILLHGRNFRLHRPAMITRIDQPLLVQSRAETPRELKIRPPVAVTDGRNILRASRVSQKKTLVPELWRTHSCVPCRDPSRHPLRATRHRNESRCGTHECMRHVVLTISLRQATSRSVALVVIDLARGSETNFDHPEEAPL